MQMPRPNKPRQVSHEAHVAGRIKMEREKRGLTYERLAEKMTEAGCAMQGSAIFKIENGKPPRRITLDEAVTFAQVFGLKLPELLVPPALAASREAQRLWEKYESLREDYLRIDGEMYDVEQRLVDVVEQNPEAREALEASGGEDVAHSIKTLLRFRQDPALREVNDRRKAAD